MKDKDLIWEAYQQVNERAGGGMSPQPNSTVEPLKKWLADNGFHKGEPGDYYRYIGGKGKYGHLGANGEIIVTIGPDAYAANPDVMTNGGPHGIDVAAGFTNKREAWAPIVNEIFDIDDDLKEIINTIQFAISSMQSQ